MVDIENISDLYYERISNTTNPGPVLARFMGELTNRSITKSHVIMMNKFVRNYGRFLVFFAVLDLADVQNLGDNLYPLLSAICKRRFERKHSSSVVVQYEKLNREVSEIEKQISHMKNHKIKFPSSDDLGKANNAE